MANAVGGSRWSTINEVVAIGDATISGLHGPGMLATDMQSGRYAERFQIAVMGKRGQVFDGRTVWSQDISGGVHALNAPFAVERSVTNAYLGRRAYLTSSNGARFTCLPAADEDGARVARVMVQPRGGIPAILSIDEKTHLLSRISERLPTSISVTRFSDYRQVGDLVLPFAITSGTQTEPEDEFAVQVRRYVLRRSVIASDFKRPVFLHTAEMLGNAPSTTVPIRLEGRQLLVWASINGRSPMPFILDTGGHAILTTGAARALGLRSAGAGSSGGAGAGKISLQYARVRTVTIGNARLHDQTFLVIPYPYSFYERGKRQPLAGILGLEVFERFAARIDYGRLRLTLTPLNRFAHKPGGSTVAITFQEDMPLAHASIEGHGGLFGVDTGNAGSVVVFGTFLRQTGLLKQYSGVRAEGQGTGGANTGRLVNLRSLTFGGRKFAKVPAFFTQMKTGSFSSWTEAGNIGYEILSRTVPTFDYAHGKLFLDSSSFAHEPPINRAGFSANKPNPYTFRVFRVNPNSPASAAGIVIGDEIVQINGKPVTSVSYGDLYEIVTSKTLRTLRLRVRRSGKTTDIVLRP